MCGCRSARRQHLRRHHRIRRQRPRPSAARQSRLCLGGVFKRGASAARESRLFLGGMCKRGSGTPRSRGRAASHVRPLLVPLRTTSNSSEARGLRSPRTRLDQSSPFPRCGRTSGELTPWFRASTAGMSGQSFRARAPRPPLFERSSSCPRFSRSSGRCAWSSRSGSLATGNSHTDVLISTWPNGGFTRSGV